MSLSASNSARIKSDTSITAHDDSDSGATSGAIYTVRSSTSPNTTTSCSICGGIHTARKAGASHTMPAADSRMAPRKG